MIMNIGGPFVHLGIITIHHTDSWIKVVESLSDCKSNELNRNGCWLLASNLGRFQHALTIYIDVVAIIKLYVKFKITIKYLWYLSKGITYTLLFGYTYVFRYL